MRKDIPNITFEVLLKKIKEYISEKSELDLIRKAYMYAFEKHFGKKRLTGEDYITHPLNVAYILTEIHADYQTICAALLHDVIEDCDVTKEEINSIFGDEIGLLVDGVTKINRLNFSGDNEAVIANHRKILVGLSEDVRVIIIKLADRLHNMRTLWVIPEDSQKEKAKETLDILTPIAHRLGIGEIKSELEDLSLRYYKPDIYFEIVEKLNQSKVEREELVEKMKKDVSTLLNEHEIKHEIKGRAKSVYSIYKKMDKGKKFSDIYDLLAMRVYVDTEAECYQVLGIIHSKYKPIPKRFKDYIAMPKTNMYQSLHTTVIGEGGQLFEIQIRTYEMDKVAELGIASHWSYKEHGSNIKASMQNAMEQKLQFFRNIMDLKNDETNDEEFVKSVSEDVLKENNIYVFTPKGDVIELPLGSTPIDFAYRVHSGVGDKMVGAIVNNSIVPLDYVLQNNDVVKINTNKNSMGPSREWINMAFTNQAKNKIKAFYNRLDKEEYVSTGEEILKEELRKKKISVNDFLSNDNVDKLLKELKLSSLEELYTLLGSNKITATSVINSAQEKEDKKEEIILKKTSSKTNVSPNIKTGIIVEGIDEIKVNIASCCNPIPGDDIVGYITKGNGISVHRIICPNISELDKRLIDVRWDENTTNNFSTTILVRASNNKDVLLSMISKTSNFDIVIQSINTLNSRENYLLEVTLLVENKEKLERFMDEISHIDNVISTERLVR